MPTLWSRSSGLEQGRAVVFLHGLFASSQNWQSVIKLVRDDFRTISLDMPNHGNSPAMDPMDYPSMVKAVLQTLDDLGEAEVDLVGHSMGGKVAMLLALEHPERVRHLVVEDIAPVTYPPWFASVMQAMVNLPLTRIKSRQEADRQLGEDIFDPALRTFLLTNLVRGEAGFQWRLHLDNLIRGGPHIAGFPETQRVGSIPSLFVCGADSPYVQDEGKAAIASLFPSSKLLSLPKVDHWLHSRVPGEFASLMRDFLNT